jgi:dethiobiotin synthetase
MNYFVTAISTDSGKTIVSAILCEALKADYWKPVQAGTPTDSDQIRKLTGSHIVIHPETFRLDTPASPHAAAKAGNVLIRLDDFSLPQTSNNLVIEGAGGCLVPLNDHDFVIDLATKFDCRVILVSNHYLGSINHTLLTWECLVKRKISVEGIVFNGVQNPETERIILHHTGLKCLLKIRVEENFTPDIVKSYAQKINGNWTK